MAQTQRAYRIGEIAAETGVTVETLRYYERLGLLPAPPRTDGGARRYGREIIERVRFVKQAQTLGLTLREVGELVGAGWRRTPSACRRVHALLTKHLDDIDRRMAELVELRRVLAEYRQTCDAALDREPAPACPTLDALEKPHQ